MKDVFNGSNIPVVSVDEAVERMSVAYCSLINKGYSVSFLPSVMLWGPPGVGKSDAIRELAKEIERKTEKRVNVTDVRLLLFNPIDLRGIPTANEDKTLAVWLKPKIFQMDESEDVINILFLDELSACSQSVQAAAYQITLDRVVGEHKLAENCIVIAAGNRITDKSVAFKMPKALANRLCHIEISANFESWKKWAKAKHIHYKVVDFLVSRREFFMSFDTSKDDLAFPTPRSWEMVSNILYAYDGNVSAAYSMIAGCVGNVAAVEFLSWCKVYNELPSVEDIFTGKNPQAPKKPNALFALVSSMVAYAQENKNNVAQIGNAIAYSEQFSPDFSVSFMKEIINLAPDFNKVLVTLPEYRKWMDRKGRYLNGIV